MHYTIREKRFKYPVSCSVPLFFYTSIPHGMLHYWRGIRKRQKVVPKKVSF